MSDPKKPAPKAAPASPAKPAVKVEARPEPKAESKLDVRTCGACVHYKPVGDLKDHGPYGKCLKWVPTLPTNLMTPHGAVNRHPLVLVTEDACGAYQAKA